MNPGYFTPAIIRENIARSLDKIEVKDYSMKFKGSRAWPFQAPISE
jgi:hypothetical protein